MKISLAGCVMEDSEGKILLIHRNTSQFKHWELPGGKVETGENERQAAIRELLEELGVGVEIVRELGRTSFADKNGHFDYVWFKTKILSGTPQPQEEKFDLIKYFSWGELKERNDLSENTKNLVNAYFNKQISLQ